MYEQIYQYIKDEIRKGNIRPEKQLPSSRELAKDISDQYSASDRVLDLSGKGEDDQNTEDSCDHDRDSGWSGDTVFSGVFRR